MKARIISSRKIIEDYFYRLCNIVHAEEVNGGYLVLCRRLFDTEFKWFILNDDNRAEDGLWLRDRYPVELRDVYQEPCNMLEMLIALAERFEEIVHKEDQSDCVARYFWEMMENCGLARYNDNWFSENLEDYKRISGKIPGETGWDTCLIDRLIDRIVNREYSRLGNGGLFPLRKSKKDQTKVELWYQLSEYINENYSIIDEKR